MTINVNTSSAVAAKSGSLCFVTPLCPETQCAVTEFSWGHSAWRQISGVAAGERMMECFEEKIEWAEWCCPPPHCQLALKQGNQPPTDSWAQPGWQLLCVKRWWVETAADHFGTAGRHLPDRSSKSIQPTEATGGGAWETRRTIKESEVSFPESWHLWEKH